MCFILPHEGKLCREEIETGSYMGVSRNLSNQLIPLMDEAKKQLDELDEEDRKLDEQRSRHKIQKSRAAKPLV